MKVTSLQFFIALILLGSSSQGWAQDTGDSPSKGNRADQSAGQSAQDEKAREHYLRGDRYYSEGDYEAAIVEFQAAYDLSQRPRLLFNLANSYERLNRYEEAVAALRKFAPSVPEYEQEAIARRIRSLEVRADEQAGRVETQLTSSAGVRQTQQTTASQPTLGWVLVGTGLAVAAGGGYFGYRALTARDDAKGLCVDGLCPGGAKGSISDDKTYSLIADIGIGIGAATAITGLVLILTHDRTESQNGLSAVPTSDGFQVGYSGQF